MDRFDEQVRRESLQRISEFALSEINMSNGSLYKINIREAAEFYDSKYTKKSKSGVKKLKSTDRNQNKLSQELKYSLRGRQVLNDHVFEELKNHATQLEPHVWIQNEGNPRNFEYKQLLVPWLNLKRKRKRDDSAKGHHRNVFISGVQFDLYIGSWGMKAVHGFGVFALEPIPRGKAVCEYSGELLTKQQADAREKEFGCQYMYDLEDMMECLSVNGVDVRRLPRAIDSRAIGNASRFINHSCDPNLVVKTHHTFVQNTFEAHGHCRVVFNALRSINKGDELTVDYYPGKTKEDLMKMEDKVKCQCKAGKGICRGWIFLRSFS